MVTDVLFIGGIGGGYRPCLEPGRALLRGDGDVCLKRMCRAGGFSQCALGFSSWPWCAVSWWGVRRQRPRRVPGDLARRRTSRRHDLTAVLSGLDRYKDQRLSCGLWTTVARASACRADGVSDDEATSGAEVYMPHGVPAGEFRANVYVDANCSNEFELPPQAVVRSRLETLRQNGEFDFKPMSEWQISRSAATSPGRPC